MIYIHNKWSYSQLTEKDYYCVTVIVCTIIIVILLWNSLLNPINPIFFIIIVVIRHSVNLHLNITMSVMRSNIAMW